jgi:hypothetical protein
LRQGRNHADQFAAFQTAAIAWALGLGVATWAILGQLAARSGFAVAIEHRVIT